MNNSVLVVLTIGLLSMMTAPFFVTAVNASPDVGPVQIGPYTDQAVEHINQAQAALQNGDTQGANNHLELAKQSLGKAVPDEQGFIGSGRTDEIPVPDN